MDIEPVASALLHTSLAAAAAVTACLALRRPLRRLFGARIAYGFWTLVPLVMLVALVRGRGARPDLAAAVGPALAAAPVAAEPPMAAIAAPVPWPPLLLAVWLAGALVFAGVLALRQRRYVRSLGPLAPCTDGTWRSDSGDAPVVLGLFRPRIVLPADFESRYAPPQATLVLAHERAHVARGDVFAHLVVATVRCLQWFDPLVHIAARKFRDDQELACDATVLAAHPAARRRYAGAMLDTRLAAAGLPVGCHWTSGDAFRERIMMLKEPLPGALRRHAGRLVIVALLALSSIAAWAALPATGPAAGIPFVSGDRASPLLARFDPRGLESVLDVTGESLAQLDGGLVEGGIGVRAPLRFATRLEDGRTLALEIRADARAPSPGARWQLAIDGEVLRSASTLVGDRPVVLDVGVLPAGARLPAVTVQRNGAHRLHPASTVRSAALQVASRAGYRVRNPDALPMDRTIADFRHADPALAPEIALQHIAKAAGTAVGIEDGVVTFLPLDATARPGAARGEADELIDLAMRVEVGTQVLTPRLVVRDGETFAVRSSGDDGKDLVVVEGASHRVADDMIHVRFRIVRNGVPVQAPSMSIRDGATGRILIGDAGGDGVEIEVTPTGHAAVPGT